MNLCVYHRTGGVEVVRGDGPDRLTEGPTVDILERKPGGASTTTSGSSPERCATPAMDSTSNPTTSDGLPRYLSDSIVLPRQ